MTTQPCLPQLQPSPQHLCCSQGEPTHPQRNSAAFPSHIGTSSEVPNPRPFPTGDGSQGAMGAAMLGCSDTHGSRGVANCSLAFSLIRLFSVSLWMMSMSKAAAAIRGDCTQHPSQISYFSLSVYTVSRLSKLQGWFVSQHWRQRSSPAHALNPHLSPSPIPPGV